ACVPLVLSRLHAVFLDERRIRLVPVRALPRGRLEKARAELLLPLVERGDARASVRLPLLARVDDPVGLVEALGRAALDVRGGALLGTEARDVRRREVDLRLAAHHPLRDRRAHAGGLLPP